MRQSWTTRMAAGLLALGLAGAAWADEEQPVVPAVLRDAPEGGLNKDGTPVLQLVGGKAGSLTPPTDAAKLATPDSAFVGAGDCAACQDKTYTLELSPISCMGFLRHCCGGKDYEPLAPLSASGTSHLDSALVGDRFIFRYDAGWGMKHSDRAEWYMARNRSVPAGGGRGLLRPEVNTDAQELSAYLEMGICQRLSVFAEMPVRFLNNEVNKDYYGWGDLSGGVKFTYCVEERSLQTVLLRVTTPTGDSYHGLGTGHSSIEPGLLIFERILPGVVLEAELKDWIPIDGTLSAGNILRYGVSVTCDFYTSGSGHYVKTVAEVAGWTVLRGMNSDAYPTPDPFTYTVVESNNRDTILNGSLGLRCGGDKGDVYLGYTRGLTGPRWFESGLRLELRLLY